MFLNPEDTIASLFLKEDLHVADLGAGIGAYSIPIAKRLHAGKVYAIDINQNLFPHITERAKALNLRNVEVLQGDIEQMNGTNLSNASVDAAILINTLFQSENRNSVLHEAKRILKPGGKILFIDWAGSFGNMGPREEDVISREEAERLFKKAGFIFKSNVCAGDYHYGAIFER